jgi:alkaline phosphatase D
VVVEYGEHLGRLGEGTIAHAILPKEEEDYTGTVQLENLSPNTTYYYRLLVDGDPFPADHPASFKTFPEVAAHARIGFLADVFFKEEKSAPALQALSGEEPDLVLILGDWPHGDPKQLSEMRRMYRSFRNQTTTMGSEFVQHILWKVPVARVWDDHDYGTNNSDKTFPGRQEAIQAHDEYWPSYGRPNPQDGIWHKFRYGDLVEVFVLDLRSQRDPDSYLDPRFIPDNRAGSNRDELRYDPGRSMLDGDASDGYPTGQKQWLKEGLLTSTARWKIIASTVPWNPTVPKDDGWWDFMAERQELMQFIETNEINNVLVVSGDIHSGGAIDDGSHSGLPEMSVPICSPPWPLQTTCWLHGPARYLSCGDWSNGGPLETGVGYGLVTLTGDTAVVEVKSERGETLLDLSVLEE